jgi:hypothetical protein
MPKKVRIFNDKEILKIARYYLATRNSYDACGKVFNTDPMNIRTCLQTYLPKIDLNLYEKCNKVLEARKRENKKPVYPHNEMQKAETMKKVDDCIYNILKQSNEEYVKITRKMLREMTGVGDNAFDRHLKTILNNPFCRYTRIAEPHGSMIIYYYKLKPE